MKLFKAVCFFFLLVAGTLAFGEVKYHPGLLDGRIVSHAGEDFDHCSGVDGKDAQYGTLRQCPSPVREVPNGYVVGGVSRSVEIKSPDGRPVFRAAHVKFRLLNWAPHYADYYGGSGRAPRFPASTDPMIQSAMVRLTPQKAWDQFAMVHQDVANIQDPFMLVSDEQRGDLYRVKPESEIIFPAAPTTNPDVFDVHLLIEPEQVYDHIFKGITKKRFLAALGAEAAGAYLLYEVDNKYGRAGGYLALAIADAIASYQRFEYVSAVSFRVTATLKRGGETIFSKKYQALTGAMVPIFSAKFVLFYDNYSGGFHWKSWDNALGKAMEDIRELFDRDWTVMSRDRWRQQFTDLQEVKDVRKDEEEIAELDAKIKAVEEKKRLLIQIAEREKRLKAVQEELDKKPKPPENR